MSAQTTRALLCLGSWSLLGMIKDEDVLNVVGEADLKPGESEPPLERGWDCI